ncbi:MAG: hypothetical protein AB2A00_42725 [Myxococcota bacterium]
MKRVVLPMALLFTQGCINLDQEYQVKDLRILAMRVDPPELLYSFLHLAPSNQRGPIPLGPYSVTAQVLAVDPQGRDVEVNVRLCPETDEADGCEGYKVRENAPAEEIRAVVPLVHPTTTTRKADLELGGELAVPSQHFTFTSPAVDYMLLHDADGRLSFNSIIFPSTPSFVVRMTVPGTEETEVAFKRFVLSMDISPQGLTPEQREPLEELFTSFLGLGFCPEGTDPEADVQCIKRRVPNKNPTLERVLYRLGDKLEPGFDRDDVTSGGQLTDFSGRVKVEAGRIVRLRPVVASDDRQPYQAFNYNLQERKVELKNFTEDMVFSWYTTSGAIDPISADDITPQPDVYYQISADTPAGPSYVWVVVRDQRGGVDWRRLDFEITAPRATSEGIIPGLF